MKKFFIATLLTLLVCLGNLFAADEKAFFKAIKNQDPGKVEAMLKADKELITKVDRRSKMMPFHLAVKLGNQKLADLLLKYGADINKNDKSSISGYSPIYYAIRFKNEKMVEYLLNKGAKTYEVNDMGNLLILAVQKDLENVALKFIESKQFKLNTKSDSYKTALHYAVNNKNLKLVKALLENGATATALGDGNLTPLHIACEKNLYEIADLLLKHGANPNIHEMESLSNLASDLKGRRNGRMARTPLHYAASEADLKLVKLLVEAGANVNSIAYNDRSPLHYSAYRGANDIVSYLVSKGADVNYRGKTSEDTPLGVAMYRKKHETVKLLKSLGGKK